MSIDTKIRPLALALIVTQLMSGCTGVAIPAKKEAKLVQGPPITDIFTPFDLALVCLKGKLRNDVAFSVGAILDQTGKDAVTDGGSGKFVTQGAGDMVQSALFQAGVTLLNRRDPRIIESEAKWGILNTGKVKASDYFITGSINSLDFIPGGGFDVQISGVGPAYSQTRIIVGLDLSLTDAKTSQVVANVSLQKQIIAQDYSLNAGRFTGRTLLNVQIGAGEREATNFALRQMLNLATFELLSQVIPASKFVECRGTIPEEYGSLRLTRSSVSLYQYEQELAQQKKQMESQQKIAQGANEFKTTKNQKSFNSSTVKKVQAGEKTVALTENVSNKEAVIVDKNFSSNDVSPLNSTTSRLVSNSEVNSDQQEQRRKDIAVKLQSKPIQQSDGIDEENRIIEPLNFKDLDKTTPKSQNQNNQLEQKQSTVQVKPLSEPVSQSQPVRNANHLLQTSSATQLVISKPVNATAPSVKSNTETKHLNSKTAEKVSPTVDVQENKVLVQQAVAQQLPEVQPVQTQTNNSNLRSVELASKDPVVVYKVQVKPNTQPTNVNSRLNTPTNIAENAIEEVDQQIDVELSRIKHNSESSDKVKQATVTNNLNANLEQKTKQQADRMETKDLVDEASNHENKLTAKAEKITDIENNTKDETSNQTTTYNPKVNDNIPLVVKDKLTGEYRFIQSIDDLKLNEIQKDNASSTNMNNQKENNNPASTKQDDKNEKSVEANNIDKYNQALEPIAPSHEIVIQPESDKKLNRIEEQALAKNNL